MKLLTSHLPSQIHAHRQVTITSVLIKALGSQVKGDETDVGIVHSLELDAGIGTIPCCFVQQVLQRLHNFLEQRTL